MERLYETPENQNRSYSHCFSFGCIFKHNLKMRFTDVTRVKQMKLDIKVFGMDFQENHIIFECGIIRKGVSFTVNF